MSLDGGDLTQIMGMVKDMIKTQLSVEIEVSSDYHYDNKSVEVTVRLILDGETVSYTSGSFDVKA